MRFAGTKLINRQKVYDCIDAHSEGMKVSEVASELGLSVPEVTGHVTRLYNEGRVFHSPRADAKVMTWRTRP